MAEDLKSLLTPSLFKFLATARIPHDQHKEPNWADVGRLVFKDDGSSGGFTSNIRERAWPALKAIGNLGLDNVPDLMQFLPAPSDPEFPLQALGLVVLLDQAPRAWCSGVDARYTASYFGILSQGLLEKYLSLPDDQRPDTWERWDALGISFDWWMVAHFWFGAPMVHAETVELQEKAVAYTTIVREAVEKRTGQSDPYRDDNTIFKDVHAFPRVFIEGPPRGNVSMVEFAWWMCMIMDIHKPIIDKYGYYPYNNAPRGREDTEADLEWMNQEPMFRGFDPEARKRIREDVLAGRWTPLGDGPRSEGRTH
jgi:uncharacterized protein (DUF924 family)